MPVRGSFSASTPIMSCASPRTPCSGPNRRVMRTPTCSSRSTACTRSDVTLAGWQSTPTRRPRSRSRRSLQITSSPVFTTAERSVYRNRPQRHQVSLDDDPEAHGAAFPLLLETALDQAQLGRECLRGDAGRRLVLALERRDVLGVDAREVHRLVLLRQRLDLRIGARARRRRDLL